MLARDKVLAGVDQGKFIEKMNLMEANINKESLSRYYAFHKLKSQLTARQSPLKALKEVENKQTATIKPSLSELLLKSPRQLGEKYGVCAILQSYQKPKLGSESSYLLST